MTDYRMLVVKNTLRYRDPRDTAYNDFYTLKPRPPNFEEILEAVTEDGLLLHGIPPERMLRVFVNAAISSNGLAIQFVPDEMMSRELCLAAVIKTPSALTHVPSGFLTTEMVEIGISTCPHDRFAERHLTERAWCIRLSAAPECIIGLARDKQTQAMIESMASQPFDLKLLSKINPALLSDKILLEALGEQSILTGIPKVLRIRLGELTANKYQPDDLELLLSNATQARDVETIEHLLVHYQALAVLKTIRPDIIEPYIKTDKDIETFREVFGSKQVIKLAGSRRIAKQWLSEDMGL